MRPQIQIVILLFFYSLLDICTSNPLNGKDDHVNTDQVQLDERRSLIQSESNIVISFENSLVLSNEGNPNENQAKFDANLLKLNAMESELRTQADILMNELLKEVDKNVLYPFTSEENKNLEERGNEGRYLHKSSELSNSDPDRISTVPEEREIHNLPPQAELQYLMLVDPKKDIQLAPLNAVYLNMASYQKIQQQMQKTMAATDKKLLKTVEKARKKWMQRQEVFKIDDMFTYESNQVSIPAYQYQPKLKSSKSTEVELGSSLIAAMEAVQNNALKLKLVRMLRSALSENRRLYQL